MGGNTAEFKIGTHVAKKNTRRSRLPTLAIRDTSSPELLIPELLTISPYVHPLVLRSPTAQPSPEQPALPLFESALLAGIVAINVFARKTIEDETYGMKQERYNAVKDIIVHTRHLRYGTEDRQVAIEKVSQAVNLILEEAAEIHIVDILEQNIPVLPLIFDNIYPDVNKVSRAQVLPWINDPEKDKLHHEFAQEERPHTIESLKTVLMSTELFYTELKKERES